MSFYKIISIFVLTFLFLYPFANVSNAKDYQSIAETVEKNRKENSKITAEAYSNIDAAKNGTDDFSCLDIDWDFDLDFSGFSFSLADLIDDLQQAFVDVICDSSEGVYNKTETFTDSYISDISDNVLDVNRRTNNVTVRENKVTPDVKRLVNVRKRILDLGD